MAAAPPDQLQSLPKPSRTTTKRFVALCLVACFGTLWLAILRAPATVEWLSGPAFLAVVGLFTAYTGTGHLDLRAMAMLMAGRRRQESSVPPWGGDHDRPG